MKRLGALVVLLFAVVLELRFASAFSSVPDLALAVLLTFAVIFSTSEIMFFVLVALLAISWQPAPSWELVYFAAIPLAATALSRRLTLQAWATNAVTLALGILAFYLLSDWRFIPLHPTLFIELWLSDILFGMTVFSLMEKVFPERRAGYV